jgi:lipopolysaccharide/colanic/teichoic acid biosynthesis glycosyltransferase
MIQLVHRALEVADGATIRQLRTTRLAEAAPPPSASCTLWGLTPRQLHDAYWRSKGIQCVRRGEAQPLQRAAELFLLIEAGQLVLFDVSQISDRLTWRDAVLTRVRLVHECRERYSERVVLDEAGMVQRIARKYRPAMLCSTRVIITSSRRIASQWMSAAERRQGLRRVRQAVAWTQVDHWRGTGAVFRDGTAEQEMRLLDELVERWACPGMSIEGLEEIESGVWHVRGEPLAPNVVRIGPLWLGRGAGTGGETCQVGPAWKPDQEPLADPEVQIKDIDDVEPPEPRPAQTPSSPGSERRPRQTPLDAAIKRGIDIVGSIFALIVSLPVMCAIAVLILLEDGRPLFFGHTRQGKGGRVFRCWKFRTMQRNAEQIARQLQKHNVCDGPQVYIENDPRVTRVGRFLRAANLDELPQFWNVLVGQMSIVGPRPSPDRENQYCPAWRDLRLSVRPGITGLWQLKRTRRRGADFQEWIKYDIQYVQQASFWLDLAIIIRTALMLAGWRRPRAMAEKK